VVSDLVLTRKGATASNVIGVGAADAVIAFDQMVAASDRVVGVMGPATRVVGSTHHTPTGAIVAAPFIPYPAAAEFEDRFARGEEADDRWMDAAEWSGEPKVIVAPLPAGLARRVDAFDPALHEQLRIRTADLVGWQDAEWAAGFLITIERVAAAEAAVDPTSFALTAAAAHGLHKFMAYKDEYEVARLMLAPEAEQAVRSAGGSAATMAFHLHPPLLRAVGVDRKLRFTAKSRRAFAVLARGKRLRGTAADPFGRAEVRKVERELIVEYEELLDMLIAGLRAEPSADRLGRATTIAELADSVRGFEDLKLARAAEYREAVRTALQGW